MSVDVKITFTMIIHGQKRRTSLNILIRCEFVYHVEIGFICEECICKSRGSKVESKCRESRVVVESRE